MKAVYVKPVGTTGGGARIVDVLLIADNVPATLPVNGAGITGLEDTDVFAPFSALYIVGDAPNKVFITNESGHFKPQ